MDSIRKGTEISFGMVRQLLAVVTSLGRLKQEAGGPLAIINATHDAAKRGSADLIILTAMLSLNFAVLNLLPIPVLDGGHLLLLSVEAVRRRRLSARAQQTALAVGLATLAVIIVLVLAKDISTLFLNRP
jgi:regulator of sigma E protease